KARTVYVSEKPIEQLVVGDEEIHAAVKVKVSHCRSHAFSRMRAQSILDRGIPECPVSVIEEQLVGSWLVHLWMTVVAMALVLTDRLVLSIPLEIVDDYQVQETIIIHVHPNPTHPPERAVLRIGLIESCLGGYIGECSVSVVVVERIVVHAADKNVFVSVVIVVANGNAGVVASAGQTCLGGDVREMPFAVIF